MKRTHLNYTLFGVGFGLSFPIVAIVADCFIFNDLPFQLNVMGARIQDNPIHYIIFLAPLVLGLTFYRIGRSIATQNELTKRLKRSNKAINESNELLDAFNYHVNHDLKTVLSNQLILAKMIGKYTKSKQYDKVDEIAKKMLDAGQNSLLTVANFLKISEEGFTHQIGETINVNSELQRIVKEHHLDKDLSLSIGKLEYDSLTINPKIFESIILNLLTNAIKYAVNQPKVVIDFVLDRDVKKILIADNGIGIDLKLNGDQLFKPFNRIKNNLKREGTGIGLFLIKKMILSVGGDIEVMSDLGKGTTFTLIFYPTIN